MKLGLLALLTLTLGIGGVAWGQGFNNDTDAAAVRKKLEELRRARAERPRVETFLPWERTNAPAPGRRIEDVGIVRVVNEMDRLRGVLIFEKAGDGLTSETLRMVLMPQAEEWVTLAAGDWNVKLVAGEPGRAVAHNLDQRAVKIAPRERREMVLDGARQEKWIARGRALAAEGEKRNEEKPTDGNGAPMGSVTTEIRF